MTYQNTKTTPQSARPSGEAANLSAGLGLLTCPFCGSEPKLKNGKIKCENNQCKVQPKIAAWYAPGYDEKAANDWNTRYTPNA